MRALILSQVYTDESDRRKLRELAGLGWAITAALPGGTTGADGPVRLAPVPVSGPEDDPFRRRWSRRTVRTLLTDVRPDVVQIEEEPGTQAAAMASREAERLGIPSIIFSWDSLPHDRGYFERRRHRATMARVAGAIGGNSLAAAQLTAAAPGVPVLTLPQTGVVPPTSLIREPKRELAMAFVGRFIPERGTDLLLRTCGQLIGPWTLDLIGTGPEQEALEALAQRLGLSARLRWLGTWSRAQVAAHWSEVDCLVVPSRKLPDWLEPHSPVLLDAMAHGVAVVVTDAGALPELAGEGGIVVRSEEDLLIALQELITSPDRRTALGRAGRQRVLDRYVDRAIARATDSFWRELLARQSSSGSDTGLRSRAD